jgi:hypothetical protein
MGGDRDAAYVTVAETTGRYTGLAEMGGINLYSRVAGFADCSRFTPPAGTRVLCERTPPEQRPGPFYYSWDARSPAWSQIGAMDTRTADLAGPFARKALLAQPLDYARVVAKDLVRYVDPTVGTDRPYAGISGEVYLFSYRDPKTEALIQRALRPTYAGVTVRVRHAALLEAYQRSTRVGGLMLLVLLGVALAGAGLGRGPARRGAMLVGATALVLFAVPVMTLSYDLRYGIPGTSLLAAATALGAAALAARRARS